MKILLLSPNQMHRYNWGHQLFRNEIGNQHEVIYYGKGYPNYNENLGATEIIKKYCGGVDAILTYGLRYSLPFKGIAEVDDVIKIHISVDYVNPTLVVETAKMFEKHGGYDIMFGITTKAVNRMKRNNACRRIYMLPFAVDTNLYKKKNLTKSYDVMAIFNRRVDIYPNRVKIIRAIQDVGASMFTDGVKHNGYIDVINKSRIAVTSNNIHQSLSLKYTEFLACGTFMLADNPEDLELLGYKDGQHLVIYDTIKDFKGKVKYYLKNSTERERIATKGMEFVRKNHNCKIRVAQFTEIIKKEFGI
jgi:hypothetical protein